MFIKLFDAIDEHGENWEHISKEIFNNEVSPNNLERIWSNFRSKFPSRSSKGLVYPFWTTKETFKLIDAVKACGEDWEKISVEWFDGERSHRSLKGKWEYLWNQDEIKRKQKVLNKVNPNQK